MQTNGNRIVWIDIAKGIAIVLVILGHTVRRGDPVTEDIVRGLIFSFHMPLFVVMSSITTRLSHEEKIFIRRTEKSFVRLVIPAISVYAIRVLISAIQYGVEGSKKAFLADCINTIVYSSGVDVAAMGIKAIGSLWFLIVLFFSRTTWDYLNLKFNNRNVAIACIMFASIGYCFSKVQWLPFSFDLTLTILPFMLMGRCLKDYAKDGPSLILMMGSLIVWIVLFVTIYRNSGHYLELATREFPLMPLSYACAVSGVVFVSELCKYISKVRVLSGICSYLGMISMEIYIIHAMDGYSRSIWGWPADNTYGTAVLRILADILFAILLFKLKSAVMKSRCKSELR